MRINNVPRACGDEPAILFKAQYVFQGLVFPGIANVMDSGKVSHFR